MLEDLQWPSFQHCQYESRFYNIVYHSSVHKVLDYFSNTAYPTRHHHPLHFGILNTKTIISTAKSIHDWNNLPTDTIESQSLELFLEKL